MTTSPKRILFMAEAVTLAHVARCVALADGLHDTGNYSIALAANDRYDGLLGELPYPRIPLYSVSNEYFLKKLATGSPLYDVNTLCRYVEDDIKIIEDFKPDFIFGDFRLSLAISGKLKNIPYATITNAYWSPYAAIDYTIPEIPLTRIFGVAVAQTLFDWVKPIIFKIHSLAFNKACKKLGQPPLRYDMREIYTHADYTLYADMESLIPMQALPANHHFIGPVLWSAKVPLPDWWEALPTDKPVVFVTLGSSGDSALLPMIIDTLGKMPVTAICVTGKMQGLPRYPNVHAAEFLPADAAVKKADVVICNGGSPMVYQTLVANKPVIGIPCNLDQYLMMGALKAVGKGQLIRAGKADAKAVHDAVKQALAAREESGDFAPGVPAFSVGKIEELIQRATKQHP
jgi:UDP:flavonoid glycosyltransferase YjiC (YdhE family)